MADENRPVGEEARKSHAARLATGFIAAYLSGPNVLDIGYKGYLDDVVPIVPGAIGVELDYPGYDGRTLPFPDLSQDAVFASHCLEHIEDDRNALQDWFRVLKVGGFLVIMVPHQLLYEKRETLPSAFNAGHHRFYTPASLIAEVEQALVPNTYRLRHLVDNDAQFDYSIPPGRHSGGCYEIELVLEKIVPPPWQLDGPQPDARRIAPIEAFRPLPAAAPTSGNPASRTVYNPAGDATVWDFGAALPPAPRILALKLDHLGDFVIGVPALRRLRQAFPASFIRLIVGSWNRAAAEATGLVDEVVTYDFFPQHGKGWDGRPATPIEQFRAAAAGPFDVAVDLRVDEDTRALLQEVSATLRCGIGQRSRLAFLDVALPPEHDPRNRSRPRPEPASRFFEPSAFGSRMPFQHEFEQVTDFRPVEGHVIFGPHVALPCGRHEAVFDVRLDGWGLGLRRTSIVFDIARDGRDIVVFRRLRGAELNALTSGRIALTFDNDDPAARYEFRIFVAGQPVRTRLRFGGVRLSLLDAFPTPRFYPATLHTGEQLSLLVQLVADRVQDLYPSPAILDHRPSHQHIIVAPFSNSDLRDWPEAHYASLVRLLLERTDASIDLIGSPAQACALQALTHAIGGGDRVRNLGSSHPFSTLPSLLRQASLVISNNSGIGHLAAASGALTLAIYSGSHQPQEWGPRGPRSHAITLPVPCAPCGHDRRPECHYDHRCMTGLTAETVFAEAARLLESPSGPASPQPSGVA